MHKAGYARSKKVLGLLHKPGLIKPHSNGSARFSIFHRNKSGLKRIGGLMCAKRTEIAFQNLNIIAQALVFQLSAIIPIFAS